MNLSRLRQPGNASARAATFSARPEPSPFGERSWPCFTGPKLPDKRPSTARWVEAAVFLARIGGAALLDDASRARHRAVLIFRRTRLSETSFQIRVRAQLLPTLTEMYNAATGCGPVTLNTYLGELLENAIVEYRRLKIVAGRDVTPAPVPLDRKKSRGKIQQMRPEVIQRIMHLRGS